MKEIDKELIDHIKLQLDAHEDAYNPGAWERFSEGEHKERNRFIWWPLWSAAALVLITAGLYFGLKNDIKKDNVTLAKSKVIIDKNSSINSKTITLDSNNQSADYQTEIINKLAKNLTENNSNFSIDNIETNRNITVVFNSNNTSNFTNNPPVNTNTPTKEEQIKIVDAIADEKKLTRTNTLEELLALDSKKALTESKVKNKQSQNWDLGVYLAPAMGNDNKLNMNYGFLFSYKIADKLAISSGVAYSTLSTSSDNVNNTSPDGVQSAPTASIASTQSLVSSKNLQSVDASVRGLNIPLELKYSLSKKIYAVAGISALAILNNKQENNYIVNKAENRNVVNTLGVAERKTLVVSENISESETVANPDKYLGFYNFSLGYKQKISTKKNVSIEPFLRIPMKSFSNENLNLTNGGVKFKIEF